jgi:hypothetical protein
LLLRLGDATAENIPELPRLHPFPTLLGAPAPSIRRQQIIAAARRPRIGRLAALLYTRENLSEGIIPRSKLALC